MTIFRNSLNHPNTVMKLFQFLLFFMLVSCSKLFAQNPGQATEVEPFSIGETLNIHSSLLDENRIINVYLPHGYSADSAKTYPVIYLLDR